MIAAAAAPGGPPTGGPSASATAADRGGQARCGFQLCLPGFDGTLELLLQLVERSQLDIGGVSLAAVAEQCLCHLRAEQERRPIELADFVAIGSRLLLLKSRRLLPVLATVEPECVEEGVEDLQQAPLDYLRYRGAGADFRVRQQEGRRSFPRTASPPALPPQLPADPIPIDRLAVLLQRALQRSTAPAAPQLPPQIVSLYEKLEQLRAALHGAGRVSFLALAAACSSRLEIVVCFIAILHLLCEGAVEAVQEEPFGDILLVQPAA